MDLLLESRRLIRRQPVCMASPSSRRLALLSLPLPPVIGQRDCNLLH